MRASRHSRDEFFQTAAYLVVRSAVVEAQVMYRHEPNS